MNNYKLSDQTANFVDCLKTAESLFAQVSDAITAVYGEQQQKNAIREFYVQYLNMKKEIQKLMLESIDDNIADLSKDDQI